MIEIKDVPIDNNELPEQFKKYLDAALSGKASASIRVTTTPILNSPENKTTLSLEIESSTNYGDYFEKE